MIEILVSTIGQSWGYFPAQFAKAVPAQYFGNSRETMVRAERIGGVAIVNVGIQSFEGLKFGPHSTYVTLTVRSEGVEEKYTSVKLYLRPYHDNETRIDFTASPDIERVKI